MNGTVEALGVTLLEFLLHGTLVALALAAFLAAVPRKASRLRYAAGCLALAVLLAVPSVRFAAALRESKGAPTLAPVTESVSAPGAATPPAAAAPAPLLHVGPFREAVRRATGLLPTVVALWAAGVALVSARLLAGFAVTVRLRRSLRRLAEAERRGFDALARRLRVRQALEIGSSALVEVPTVVGWLRPALLVPASALTGLSPAQLEALLAHELAHVRRHDALVNVLQTAVETLLFYHPAVWWVSRTIRVERENCCDDVAVAAVGDPVSYARALVALEELRQAPTLALAANGGSLTDRVLRLAGAPARRSSPAVLAGVAALALAAFAAHGAFDTAPHDPAGAPATPETPVAAAAPEDQVTVRPAIAAAPAALASPVTALAPPVLAPPAIAIAPALAAPDQDPEETPRSTSPPPAGMPTVDELIALRQHGVTPEYLDEMRALGVHAGSIRELLRLRDAGVSPEFVRGMKDGGYDRLSVEDLIRLRNAGVSPELVRRLRRRS